MGLTPADHLEAARRSLVLGDHRAATSSTRSALETLFDLAQPGQRGEPARRSFAYDPTAYSVMSAAFDRYFEAQDGPHVFVYQLLRAQFEAIDRDRGRVTLAFQQTRDRLLLDSFWTHKLDFLYFACREAERLDPAVLAEAERAEVCEHRIFLQVAPRELWAR